MGLRPSQVTLQSLTMHDWPESTHLELGQEPGSCVGDDNAHLGKTAKVAVCTAAFHHTTSSH